MVFNVTHVNRSSAYIERGSYSFDYPCSSHSDCSPYTVFASKGIYLLEVWGASGGDQGDGMGGEGGYSFGELILRDLTKLFVEVGGSGILATGNQVQGGYNGGGYSGLAGDSKYGTGGGATDIRIENDDLLSRVIVAGGGSGSGWYRGKYTCVGKGGYGGGLTAGSGNINCSNHSSSVSSNIASQTMRTLTCSSWCGGGGGWANGAWGGGYGASGGGGSGFVFTPLSTVPNNFKLKPKHMLKRAKTLDKTTGFSSPFGMYEYGHVGHGFARITIISNTLYTIRCRMNSNASLFIWMTIIFLSY